MYTINNLTNRFDRNEKRLSDFIEKIKQELINHGIEQPFEDESKQWNIYNLYDINFFKLANKSIYTNNYLSKDVIILECVHDYCIFKNHDVDWYIFAYGHCGSYFEYPQLMEFGNRIMWSSKDFTKAEVFDILNKIEERETAKFHDNLKRRNEQCYWEQECFDLDNFYDG